VAGSARYLAIFLPTVLIACVFTRAARQSRNAGPRAVCERRRNSRFRPINSGPAAGPRGYRRACGYCWIASFGQDDLMTRSTWMCESGRGATGFSTNSTSMSPILSRAPTTVTCLCCRRDAPAGGLLLAMQRSPCKIVCLNRRGERP